MEGVIIPVLWLCTAYKNSLIPPSALYFWEGTNSFLPFHVMSRGLSVFQVLIPEEGSVLVIDRGSWLSFTYHQFIHGPSRWS